MMLIEENTKKADIASARIIKLIGEKAFQFSPAATTQGTPSICFQVAGRRSLNHTSQAFPLSKGHASSILLLKHLNYISGFTGRLPSF